MHISNKMRKDIIEEIEIPEGVEVTIDGTTLTVKGKEGEIKRTFKMHNIDFKKEGNKIILGCKKVTKREKKMIYTNKAHINNMLKGAQDKFVYELKAVYSHFPITVEVSGNEAIIKNFLGEKKNRKASIPEGAEMEVKKDFITLKAIDKDIAGQAAANLELATKIRMRDRRVFQDGIYIIKKAGKEI